MKALDDVLLLVSGVSSAKLELREEIMLELEELKIEVQCILNDTAFLIEASGKNVFWFEYNEKGTFYSLRIQSAPLDIGEKLAYGLYDHMETVIMTSATLAVAGDFSYKVSSEWACMYDMRYEFENSRLEEHNFWLRREYDCMFWAIGFGHLPGYEGTDGSDKEEEYNIMFRIWIKAFPEMGLDVK